MHPVKLPGKRFSRRRGSSTVRAVVIALSTFAILLVCFSLYQYSQLGRSNGPVRDRLPKTRTDFADLPSPDELKSASGVKVENVVIGQAQGMSLTIYRPRGTEAAAEITVKDWIPKEGADQEFLLREPVIRLRTKAGNDVRVSAERGAIEAQQQLGGVLARRGSLTGNVLIEVDRRTAEEKAALPEEQRSTLDPSALVHIEADELEFDLEYDKLIIPGRVRLRAIDASLDLSDLEIRFNQAESRVESMRVARGGRIQLSGAGDDYGLDIPGAGDAIDDELTLVDWLRNTIKARLAQQQPPPAPPEHAEEKVAEAKAAISYTEDGTPVFRPSAPVPEPQDGDSAIAYRAQFEGNVDGRQELDGATVARLTASVLRVQRDFTREKKEPANQQQANRASSRREAASDDHGSKERLLLTWEGPLLVESLAAGPEGKTRSRIEAEGAPARLAGPDGEVLCASLSYEPDLGVARFTGSEGDAAVVRSVRDGEMQGKTVALRLENDRFFIDVEGPGRVRGKVASVGARGTAEAAEDSPPMASDDPAAISFRNSLRAAGRIVEQLQPDFANGTLRRTKARLVESMTADGKVRATEEGGSLATDWLEARFGLQRRLGDSKLFVEHVLARGNTVLQDEENRMASRELEVRLAAGATGKSLPLQAIARGNVSALQGDRALKADVELIIDFERVLSTAELPITNDELQGADQDILARKTSSDGETSVRRPKGPGAQNTEPSATQAFSLQEKAVAKTMRARGNVTVQDPVQGLDLAADNVTCSLADGPAGRGIEQALISGTAEVPATVHLRTFSVTGTTIRVHEPDQWAEVPGEGRMTIRSYKDLNGKRLDEPIPIAVTWTESMGYQGRENVAHFRGNVHASSENGVTFDCDELRTEFLVKAPDSQPASALHWGFFQPLVDQIVQWRGGEPKADTPDELKREPSSIYASGDVVLQRTHLDDRGSMSTRARIAGPKLTLNLRDEVSRALIEGAGNLQLEDFATAPGSNRERPSNVLSFDAVGPSKTLIQWTGRMWYDFSINQVRFEDGVDLRHLSGQQLERFFQVSDRQTRAADEGLASFLTSDILILDFEQGELGTQPELGRLSSEKIKEFRALGSVRFQDDAKRFSVEAAEVIYVKSRQVLIISGSAKRKARVVIHRQGGLPTQMSVDRAFINLATDPPEIELAAPVGVQGG